MLSFLIQFRSKCISFENYRPFHLFHFSATILILIDNMKMSSGKDILLISIFIFISYNIQLFASNQFRQVLKKDNNKCELSLFHFSQMKNMLAKVDS